MQHETAAPLFLAIAFLSAAVVFVPVFKRLGLGGVLGYLFAGVLLGPSVLGIVREPAEILEFAELGVVFLLFLIGLELNPQRLLSMRRDIFGLGALQILACGALMTLLPLFAAGLGWRAALVVGFGLALSSTALVMQILEERGAIRQSYGRKSFAVLLMQDIAIVPLLVVVTLLAPGATTGGLAVAFAVAQGIAAIGAIVLVGHYALSPLFRLLVRFGGRETMTAAALLVVLAAATAMLQVGLSMAMGAFLAGVLLAESNYRHELEANIDPFRGLFLGLFFISVGMSIDLGLVVAEWRLILGGVLFILAGKALIVYALVRAFGSDHVTSAKSAILLSQGGEFGFVVFTAAASSGVMSSGDASLFLAAVTLSMATTPLLMSGLTPLLLSARSRRQPRAPREDFSDAESDVLVIGFGRFGQIVAQMLIAAGYRPTLIDNDPDRVTEARRFGNRVYYGDGSRLDVLVAAGAERCRLVAVCTAPQETTTTIIDRVRERFPQCKLFARAFDRRHALSLVDHGVDYQRRETFDSAIRFGKDALVSLGMKDDAVKETEIGVRRRDRERFELQRIEGFVEGHRKWREITPKPLTTPAQPGDGAERRAAE